SPEASLFLLKATARVPHGGGNLLDVESPEYKLLLRWVEQGAALDDRPASELVHLHVTPSEQTVRPGEEYALRVEAEFADGTREDVTPLCRFESSDTQIAEID